MTANSKTCLAVAIVLLATFGAVFSDGAYAAGLNGAFMLGLQDGMREAEQREHERKLQEQQLRSLELQRQLMEIDLQNRRDAAMREQQRAREDEVRRIEARRQFQAMQEREAVERAAKELEGEEQRKHFAQIATTHPDWQTVVASDEFKAYTGTRPHLKPILESGTAEQVISMLADYKSTLPKNPKSKIKKVQT